MRDVMICYDIITIMNILVTFFRANLLSGLKPATHFAALLMAVILLAACESDKKSTPAVPVPAAPVVPAAPTPPTEVTIPYSGLIREATEFKFALSSEEDMYIYTSGTADVELYNSDKVLIERSLSIRRTLSAGTYYLIAGRRGNVYIQPIIRTPAILPYTSSGQSISHLGNEDWFSFTLTSPQVVDIYTSGSTNTYGGLYDSAAGALLEQDNDDGSGSNFEISRELSAGTYHVRVSGEGSSATGSYTLYIRPVTSVSLPYTSSGFSISSVDVVDWFIFTLTSDQQVNVYTSGSTNTYGILYDSAGTRLEQDSSDGFGSNFGILRSLSAGTYYVRVSGEGSSATGSYTLHIEPIAAASVSIPYTSSGQSISSGGDVDWFSFTLTSPQYVDIDTSGSTDTYGDLYDSAGTLLASTDSGGSGSNFRIIRLLSAGTYHVRVSGEGSSTTGSYTLRIGATTSVSLPYTSSGYSISPAGDNDWFSFTLTSRQYVDIDTSGSIDTYGRLYNSAGALLEQDSSDGSGSNFRIIRLLSAGTYYVRVSGQSSSTTGSYTLRIGAVPSVVTEIPSIVGSLPYSSSGYYLSRGDNDWFSFTLTSTRVVDIYTSGSTDTYGRLYNSAGAYLEGDSNDGSGSNFGILRSLSAGTYYVRVSGQSSSTTGYYTLRIEPIATTSVGLPYTSSGYSISPAGDNDWFSFTLTSTQVVDIYTSGSIDTYGGLYHSTGTFLESDDADGSGSNFRIIRSLSAGTYYVRVSGQSSSTTGSYTLRIGAVPSVVTELPNIVGSLPYTSSGFSISPAGDNDWFSFTLTSRQYVNIDTSGSTDIDGRLYNSAGTQIVYSNAGGDININRYLSAGIYYLRVYGGYSYTTGSYTLRIQ